MILSFNDDARKGILQGFCHGDFVEFCAQKCLKFYQRETLVVPVLRGCLEDLYGRMYLEVQINEKLLLIIILFPSCMDQIHVAANRSRSTLCGACDFLRRQR